MIIPFNILLESINRSTCKIYKHCIKSGDKIRSEGFQKVFGENQNCQRKCIFCYVNGNITTWEDHKISNFHLKIKCRVQCFFERNMLPNKRNRISMGQRNVFSNVRWTKKNGEKIEANQKKRKSTSLDKKIKKQFWEKEKKWGPLHSWYY